MSGGQIELSSGVPPPAPPSSTTRPSHITWKTHGRHNLITDALQEKKKRKEKGKCKHGSLSSLYVRGQEDNVVRGNKSGLTATSKGAAKGLLLLKAQECCC